MSGHTFLSHSSANKTWVTTLANNLKVQGYDIWLDIWELIPGRSFIRALQNALDQAHAGILVVTPEAEASGWVQDEYEAMLRRKNAEKNFVIIPVMLGEGNDFPFLRNIQGVDFRGTEVQEYRRAFHELLCGLENRPPESDTVFSGSLDIPASPNRDFMAQDAGAFLEGMFDDIEHDQLCLLLAQDGAAQGPVAQRLLDRAGQRFGAEQVIHLVGRCAGEHELDAYFAALAHQCGLDNEDADLDGLERHLECRLNAGNKLCLIFDSFENGPDQGRKEMASRLRNLHSRFLNRLRVIFRGGERLFDLKFDNGQLSILNIAEPFYWPELTTQDLQEQYKIRYHGELSEQEAGYILSVSGGEPRLGRRCLQFRHGHPGATQDDYRADLLGNEVIFQLFAPLIRETKVVEQLCELLKQEALGPWLAHLADPLWRRLYWRNLLTKRSVDGHQKLVWRADVLREAGLEMLGCA